MATLTSLLNLASNALNADQLALNATSNNVANQNTPGYTREIVNWQTADYVTIGGVKVGQGVTAETASVRDRVLEQRVQQQQQTASQSDTLETNLNLVQNVFGLSSTSKSAATTTLGTAIDGLFNSFTTLEANASDPSTRSAVLTQASSLADALNSASAQLKATSTSLDNQVNDTVIQVNTLLTSVADLNLKIATTSPNSDAGPLEDQRQSTLQSLSKLIGLDQITTNNNGITLTTTGGSVLVSAGNVFPIGTSQQGGKTHLIAGVDGTTDLTGTVPLDGSLRYISGGSLGGLLLARDTNVPSYQANLDQLAYGIANAVNAQNTAGVVDSSGTHGAALFVVPATSANAASIITLAGGVTANSIAAAATGEGATGSSNAVLLAALATAPNVNGQSASGFLASFLSKIGADASSTNADNTVQQAALTQLTTQRDSLSAVSSNDEAANLTQFERSYEAASKLFSIVDTLLSAALNLGVQTSFN